MVLNKGSKLSLIIITAGLTIGLSTFLTTHSAFADTTTSSGLTKPLLAIAAAIAIAGGLIGTGNAQQGIGAAGMGIIAEKPEKFGQVLFFFVIPETLWIIGFVLGIILLLGIL
jgi:V/A-type H+-transporting ATPase subunit K